MKIIHLSTEVSEQSACKRINDSLKSKGIDSNILTLKGDINYSYISNYRIKNKIINRIEYIFKRYINLDKKRYISLNFTGIEIDNNPHILRSDIVHIHWINGGFISLDTLSKLKKQKKNLVWTVHDSWPFTAICHVRDGCDYYMNDCSKCKLLRKEKSSLIRNIINKKKKIFAESNMIFVFPTNIHKNYALKSSVFKGVSVDRMKVIGNPIETEKFFDEKYVRDREKIYLGFGAVGGINNKFKGIDHLKIALKKILNNDKYLGKIVLIVFGSNNSDEILDYFKEINIEVINKGYTKSHNDLRKIYSSIDIFISPSFEESFGQVLAESMACGCLGIAYKNTGCAEIIQDNINGYLADYKDTSSLEEKILAAVNRIEEGYNRKLSEEYIKIKYDANVIGSMYKELYDNIKGDME